MDATRRSSEFACWLAGKVEILYPACWCRRLSILGIPERRLANFSGSEIEVGGKILRSAANVGCTPELIYCTHKLMYTIGRWPRLRFDQLNCRKVASVTALVARKQRHFCDGRMGADKKIG